VAIIQAVLPYMRQQHSGHIINFSSVAGVVSFPGTSLYNSSKFAVEGISEALASEAKPFNIDVTIIQPGAFKTSFSANSQKLSNPLPIYESYHTLFEYFHEIAQGEPDKLGQAVLYAVENVKSLPLRIPLGTDSLTNIRQKLTSQLDELKKVEQLSTSTGISSTAPITA